MKRIFVISVVILSLVLVVSQTAFTQTIRIMPLGNSITEGLQGSTPVGGFRDDLGTMLTNAGINFQFVGSLDDGTAQYNRHEGHPGWKADQIDANVTTWLTNYTPDIVLLHIGTNDVSNDEANSQTIVEIESIIEKIKNYDTNTPILLCSTIPRNDAKNSNNDNLNAYIEDLYYTKKKANYNIFYVGQNEVFKTNPTWATDYLSDTVHPNNTGYAVMAGVYYTAVLNVINGTPPYVTDNFNQRTEPGETWSAEASITVDASRLTNTNVSHDQNTDWDLAVYKAQRNPSEVSFIWGPTANSAGIQEGGFALMLNKTAPLNEVDGYLLWIGTGNNINLWTIAAGVPSSGVTGGSVPSLLPNPPQAGDTLKVKMRTDGIGHHFSIFVNSDSAGIVTDSDKLKGNGTSRYAGVMLRGGTALNNDVDDFELFKKGDTTPPSAITTLQVTNTSATSISVSWNATGDDENSGLATTYDIRYATFQINNDTDFNNATKLSSPPAPADPGTQQSATITGLEQSTMYYIAIKVADEVPNWSQLSNVVNTTTLQGLEFVDDFNRTDLGADWTTDPEFQIVNGELANSSTEERWDFAAIYNTRRNPIEVSFNYGSGATVPNDFENVAIIFFESANVNANGYMAWYRPSKTGIFLWEVKNGGAFGNFVPIASLEGINLPVPVAGDMLKIQFTHENNGNHFDYYINDQFYGRLTDPDTLYNPDANSLYAGVMMHGNRNNAIDNFRIVNAPGRPSQLVKVSGDMQSGTVNADLSAPLVVRVTDDSGNPSANISVNFSVIEGNGHVDKDQGDGNLRIEAESGILTAPMVAVADGGASGGYYVATSQHRRGMDEINFYITNPATYYIWGRVYAPSGEENSFKVLVDSDIDTSVWDIAEGSFGQWRWEKIKDRTQGALSYNFAAGSHILKIVGREFNSRIDKFLITSDAGYTPTGFEGAQGYVTNEFGEVEAIFTLGTVAGQNKVKATVPILPGQEVVFTETGIADSPAKIAEISGNGQSGSGGQPLANPFVVKVTDQYDNNVSGVPVTFAVTAGNGSLSNPQPVTTGVDGQASTILTLGTAGAQNEVKASSPGTIPAEIVFTATATSGVATDLIYVSGNNQTGTVGTQLTEVLAVKVVDAANQPQANFDVTFAVTEGGGAIVETQPVKTGADGIAQVHWKLGNVVGANKAQAQSPGLNGSPLNFSATGVADVAVKMVKVDGDSATGKVNEQLTNPFRVKVTDQYNNPVQNTAVLFTVLEGGGKFLNNQVTQSVNTDGGGIAAAFLILGPVAGQFNNKVEAKKDGLTGSPVNFVASAGAANAAKIVYVSGNNQLGFVRQALPQPFKVKVMDASDNVVAGHQVVFSVQSGSGTINGDTKTTETVATDAGGFASVTFWPGPVAGELNNIVHASSTNGQNPLTNSPIIFKASAKYTATKIQLAAGNNQEGVVGSILGTALKVKVLNASDQPVANVPVTFEIKAGGGKIDTDKTIVTKNTDSQGFVSVALTLGPTVGVNNNVVHASATDGFDPLTNSPIIFTATAKASNAEKITIAGGNNQTGVVGKALPNKLQVSVQDKNGNGVVGHPVKFTITQGGGQFAGGDTVKSVNSNASGIAEIEWSLGTVVGSNNNQVKAEADDGVNPLQNSPLTFTASAGADVTDPNTSTVVATSPATADGNSVSNVTVTLLDKYGNSIVGKMVTIAVSGNHNFISPPTVQTGNDGRAVFSLTSIAAEMKTITATNSTDNIVLTNTAKVEFKAGPAARIERTSGNEQTRNVGTVLKNPLVVKVLDNFNNPVKGVAVFFEVKDGKSGGKIVENQPAVSDENGEAKATYILGNDAGSNLIEAKSGSLSGSPVLFSENGEVKSATQIVKVSGDNQNGIAGKPLAKKIVVQVLDQKDDPVKNVSVTFSVTLGGGQVSPQQVTTNAYGKASAAFTLGPNVGVHIARVEAPGLQNSPLSFIANAGSGVADKIVLISGNNQSGVVNSFAAPLKVKIVDRNNNAVANYPVEFKVISGDVTITNAQPDSSDDGGFASATVKYGTKAGNVVIQAQASGLSGSPIEFNLTALPDVAASVNLAWGNNQRGTIGFELINSLAVKIRDQYNNNVPGFSVQFVITQGDASIVGNSLVQSNSSGNASCKILLGSTPGIINVLAIASGLSGSPVAFTITAVQNNFPTIASDILDATIEETQVISFNITGSDPDGDPLQFKVWNLPTGAKLDSINATTRKFEWTPDYFQSGNYSIRLGVLDGNGGIDRDTVKIKVLNKNRKPTITSYSPNNNAFSVESGSGQQFSIEATDPDLEQIQYFWTKNDQKVAIGVTYNYSSDPSFQGQDIVVGHATDGIDTVAHKWTITVKSSVELESFMATPSTNSVGVELSWITRREQENRGFNIYRSLIREGDYDKVNDDLIPSNNSGTYTYFDDQIESGLRYYYKLEDVSINGTKRMHGPVMAEASLPQSFSLEQNYPNPFNPETNIKFQLPKHARVYIGIFNVLGQEVRVLLDKEVGAGYHTILWDGRDNYGDLVTSGIYYYRIKAENFTALKKMILLK